MNVLKRLFRRQHRLAGNESRQPFPSAPSDVEMGYYHELLRIARLNVDRHAEWEALENIGDVCRRDGGHKPAALYYRQALDIARKIGDEPRQVGSLFSLSDVHEKAGETPQAGEYRNEALSIARKSQGAILSEVGVHLASTGDEDCLKRGIHLFKLHLKLAREAGSRTGEEAALGNLGSAYQQQGYVHRAIDCFQKALAIAREIIDKGGEEAALGSLGSAYKDLGDMQKAAEYLDEALALGRKSGNGRRLAVNAFNMARLFVQEGDLERALPLAQEAAEIFEQTGDPNTRRARDLVSRIRAAR